MAYFCSIFSPYSRRARARSFSKIAEITSTIRPAGSEIRAEFNSKKMLQKYVGVQCRRCHSVCTTRSPGSGGPAGRSVDSRRLPVRPLYDAHFPASRVETRGSPELHRPPRYLRGLQGCRVPSRAWTLAILLVCVTLPSSTSPLSAVCRPMILHALFSCAENKKLVKRARSPRCLRPRH